METIKQILIRRDGMSEQEAEKSIEEARSALDDYIQEGKDEAAFYICEEYFGLEPDYIMELF